MINKEIISDDFKYLDLGDKRLNNRCKMIYETFFKNPESSIPVACSKWSDVKAIYRFYDNKKVTSKKIKESHYLKTIEDLDSEEIILKIQDTTELDYTSQSEMKGRGYLARGKSQGIVVHTTIGVTSEGLPIGVLDQKSWERDNQEQGKRVNRHKKEITEKESYKWIESCNKTDEMFLSNKKQITIGDRESDIYDLFAMERKSNSKILVRSYQNRSIKGEEKRLYELINKSELKGEMEILTYNNINLEEREKKLEIRYEKVEILKTKLSNTNKEKVKLTIIQAEEKVDKKDKLKWILLTDLEVNNLEEAKQYIKWYSYRWLIERYHYVLKSGLNIEKIQLDSVEKIKKVLSIYSIIAIRLLKTTYLIKKDIEVKSDKIFNKKEIELAYKLANKSKEKLLEIPSLRDVVRWIAQLGGFLGRKGDKEPGVKSIWIGYRKFNDILESVNLLDELE